MPGIPVRRRRLIESEEDDDEISQNGDTSLSQSQHSSSNSAHKRARISTTDETDETQPSTDGPLLPNGYRADQATSFAEAGEDAVGDRTQFQPGSIVRVQLQNFVTYTAAEFFPGPSLNMVIGPNGTGKSTLVCAICLGLGWGPQHLGRAREVSEYVKHGYQEATIEIELARDQERHDSNPVIRRLIKREGNKSHFYINSKQSTLKAVLDLARSFSIQIDNLCQFLPQDKVCEFAALTPVELLNSTQRAAAPEYMLQWHDRLKLLRSEQKRVQAQFDTDKDTLSNLEHRQQGARADVERLQERSNIQKKLEMLEKSRPFAKYRQARLRHAEAKKRTKEAQIELKKLEEEVEPSLRAVNHKQTYKHQVDKVVKDRKKIVERAEVAADDLMRKQKDMEESIADLNKEIEAERERDKSRKQDLARVEGNIRKLEKRIAEEHFEFDPLAYNNKIREKQHAYQELVEKAEEVRQTTKNQVSQGRETNERIARAKEQLANLDSQAGQREAKLRQLSDETARAWEWVQNNQNQFEHHVYGPPIIECSVKDPTYADAVESLFQKNDLLSFTTQSRSDFKKLGAQLYGTMKLAEITIRTSTGSLNEFRPPVSDEQKRAYGFEGWALEFMDGPEPVLAMLCGEVRLHQTGISLRDISQRQYETLQDSPISSWVAGKSSFQITRRREYGPGATSTRVRDIRRAQVWTTQSVDMGVKRDLQFNIEGWSEEVRELTRQAEEGKEKLRQLKEESDAIEAERKAIEHEKATNQRAHQEFKALPTRLAQEQEKYTTLKQGGAQLRKLVSSRLTEIDQKTLEKAQLALDYAQSVVDLEAVCEELIEAETILIEATSEVEVLAERNRSVKLMLDQRRVDVKDIQRKSEETAAIGRRLLDECTKVLSDEGGEEQREFLSSLPEDQTREDLEGMIESEKARLELAHAGNPNAIVEYENRQRTIDKLSASVAKISQRLAELDAEITEIRKKWEPELDALVQKISDAFSESFEQINCAGQVGIHKDDDFDQWAIQIQVKFREKEQLSQLDSHRQSGGERAVSTIFYLMALQSLARAPFRLCDEVNQGMDPRNERMVHSRMVDIACSKFTSQYFLITPKLLHNLKYHPAIRVHCIASGEYMPEQAARLDFGRAIAIRRAVKGVA